MNPLHPQFSPLAFFEKRPYADHMHWHAIKTRPNWEARTNDQLTEEGIETFFPRVKLRTIRRHQVRWVITPYYSTYLFANLSADQFHLVTKAAAHVLGFGNEPTPIPDEVMHCLKAGADNTGLITMSQQNLQRARFKALQEVEFTDGPFARMLATVLADEGKDTVQVLMKVLGAPRELKVKAAILKAA